MKLINVGPLKESDISLNNVNIFYGENGSGKTYTSYIIYGISKYIINIQWNDKIDQLPNNIFKLDNDNHISVNWKKVYTFLIDSIFNDVNSNSNEIIKKIFNQDIKEMDFKLKKEDLSFFTNWLSIDNIPKGGMAKKADSKHEFLITHEVRGENIVFIQNQIPSYISDNLDGKFFAKLEQFLLDDVYDMSENQFKKEVEKYIANMLEHMTPRVLYIPAERQGINIFYENLIGSYFYNGHKFSLNNNENDEVYSQPLPILDYINYVTQVKEMNKREIQLSDNIKNILKGEYRISENGDIMFVTEDNDEVPLDLASSSVKSLFGLHTLENYNNDIIIIDEPELNLTPANQKIMAEFLYNLNKGGNKVIISTHSDYIVKTLAVASLKEYLDKSHHNIQAFYFDKKCIQTEKDLWKLDEISIFDNTYDQLIEEYSKLEVKLDKE